MASYLDHLPFPILIGDIGGTNARFALLIDRLVHAVHTGGGLAARNLLEGRPREVLAVLDSLAGGS